MSKMPAIRKDRLKQHLHVFKLDKYFGHAALNPKTILKTLDATRLQQEGIKVISFFFRYFKILIPSRKYLWGEPFPYIIVFFKKMS